jgi:hypothetical protein
MVYSMIPFDTTPADSWPRTCGQVSTKSGELVNGVDHRFLHNKIAYSSMDKIMDLLRPFDKIQQVSRLSYIRAAYSCEREERIERESLVDDE